MIWQRGASFNPMVSGYTADRWQFGQTTNGSIRVDRESTIKPANTQYSYKLTSLTADTSIADTQYIHFMQKIEGYNYLKFIGNTATLSFWVRSSVTGIYSVAFRNTGLDLSYASEYTINQADTWEKKKITLKFDYTGGTWNTTNGSGLHVIFTLALGSTYATSSLDQWVSGNKIGSTNQVNWIASASNTFYLSNVQLELGSSDSPFEIVNAGIQVLQCQRYYEAKYFYANCVETVTGTSGYNYNMVTYVYKRAAPTVTNAGDLTIWARVAWYNATSVYIIPYNDRMMFRFEDTAGHSYNYGAALVRGTFYLDAEL